LFSSSFKDKKFNPGVFSGIPKVFQEDVPLSDVLLVSSVWVGLEVDIDAQLLALVNFGVSSDSWRSSSFRMIVYTEINSATFPNESALSKLLVFWINILMKIAAPCSITIRDALYAKVVNSLFIISIISSVSPFSSFRVANICLNNATVLLV